MRVRVCVCWCAFVFSSREAAGVSVRGLREPDPRPVHPACVPGPGVARCLSEVRRVQSVPGRVVHLLRAGREDLLQAGLHQVGPGPGAPSVSDCGWIIICGVFFLNTLTRRIVQKITFNIQLFISLEAGLLCRVKTSIDLQPAHNTHHNSNNNYYYYFYYF